MGMTHKERWEQRREKEREQQLQKEAEEALLLQQYLRKKQAERDLLDEREAKRLKDYLSKGPRRYRDTGPRVTTPHRPICA